jgi:predicted ArsR family transcriptional regulator
MSQTISPRQQHILSQLLDNRTGLSIDALAKALAISRAAIQQHVVGLEDDGHIQKIAFNKTAGRPVVIYGITDKGINCFPKQYAWFSELLLSDLRQDMGSEGFKGYLQRLGDKLATTFSSQFAGKNQHERQEALLLLMAQLGFQVSQGIEAETELPVIRANNCIYHDLAQQYHEICAFDLALMSSLLDTEVQQLSCIAKGDFACQFRIQNKTP